ncbi:MAG TPA: 50S ribosomal protein L21 [Dehalococcoidia bacterium]|jgi:large subunit ribosomal protein L21|nr:50S ribosomal protein L21 [Dehalococcoidia bacterium]|tara:strand:+ start:242 stop:556 length:315 start_codon:yes stop_codon:yes gene_type:complete
MNYAIIKTGGKQYKVQQGDVLDVELLPNEIGSTAEFNEILAVSDNGSVKFGNPTVENATVTAEVQKHYKDKKVIVFKYKAKNRDRKRKGHRQNYTRIAITNITA